MSFTTKRNLLENIKPLWSLDRNSQNTKYKIQSNTVSVLNFCSLFTAALDTKARETENKIPDITYLAGKAAQYTKAAKV